MSKRDEYYDGEEGDGSWLGFLMIAAMVLSPLVAILVFLVLVCLSYLVPL